MTVIMQGGTLLRQYIQEFLQAELPGTIDIARGQWGLDEWQLPHPGKYDTIDPTAIGNDEFPGVGAVVLNDRNWIREEIDANAQLIYSGIWTVRLVIVARTPYDADNEVWLTPEKEAAVSLRDRLVSLVRHTLLQTPSMGRPAEIRMEETTMTTDYLEPFMMNTQSKRWCSAALVNMEVHFTESTFLTEIGDANTIVVEEEKVGNLEEL